MNTPLVTCLCITRGRPERVALASRCFSLQSHCSCEFLVIADTYLDVPVLLDVPSVVITGNRPYPAFNVGQKRNYGCEWARGEYVAVFDDDDYSAPGRICQQVAELERTGAAVTGYSSMKFTDGVGWWNFNCAPGFVIGLSLCFRRDWWAKHPFPALQVGEDAAFCYKAYEAGKLAAVPDLGLMYASIHPGNTSKRDVTRPPWEPLPGFEWPGS